MRALAFLSCLGTLLFPAWTSAQTVRDIANRGACSTSGVEGLSRQLAEQQMCIRPGAFVRFAPSEGISLASGRVHPYLQAGGRSAIQTAARSVSLTITSAFRTLADQYVLHHSGGCGLAAAPGSSNHQSGRAVDVSNWSAARSALESAGCAWFGSRDAVHFDCPGEDRRSDAILAFQVLWNRNNPGDTIAEDGAYGPMTASRLASSPAGGFSVSGCGMETCEVECDGNTLVNGDCSRTTCGDICSAGACIDAECAGGDGLLCDGSELVSCTDGIARRMECSGGCEDARCVSSVCDGVGDGSVCVDAMVIADCSGGAIDETRLCSLGCRDGSCQEPVDDAGVPDAGFDAGSGRDAGLDAAFDDAGVRIPVSDPGCGCSAGAGGASNGAWVFLALAALSRRRRRSVDTVR